jgi:hypothetical protein
MRTNMQASGARSKREAVELGLRTLVKLQHRPGSALSGDAWMTRPASSCRDRCRLLGLDRFLQWGEHP